MNIQKSPAYDAGLFYICYEPKQIVMPSFDIVSKVDPQALANAVNVVTKEITNRFDFKGAHIVIDLDLCIAVVSLNTIAYKL